MASALGSVVGGLLGSNASKKAAKTQAEATDRASEVQKEMYDQTRQDLQPWTQAGGQATNSMMNLLGLGSGSSADALQQDPGYQFRLQSGLNGVQSGAAAQGNLLSGATQKALNNYAQDTASQEYGNAFNRLMGVSNLGENAAAQVGNAGTSVAQGIASNTMAGGQASAQGQVAQGNAMSSLIGNVASGLPAAYDRYKTSGSWL